jgi:mannose-6-phosphate isomerase-like protein (cupin superfamily)
MRLYHLNKIPYEPVSHDPELKKKVLARGLPCVKRLSHIVLVPGNRASLHSHPKGYEVFYFIRGAIVFEVNGKEVRLKKGDCLVVEPGEPHSITDVLEETELVYFIAAQEK